MVGLVQSMANNLKYYIKLAGMTNAEVAEAKGIAPESVSRHVNGRSAMSVKDAIEYAAILDCRPEQLLFERKPMTVVGSLIEGAEVKFYLEEDRRRVAVHCSYPPGARLLDRDWLKPNMKPFDGMYMVIDSKPMKTKQVPQSCYGKPAICSYQCNEPDCDDWHFGYFVVYPMPDNKFTLQGVYGQDLHNMAELNWACPVYDVITRPDLLGWVEL